MECDLALSWNGQTRDYDVVVVIECATKRDLETVVLNLKLNVNLSGAFFQEGRSGFNPSTWGAAAK